MRVDHGADVVAAGGGGRVGGDVPQGLAGADHHDAGRGRGAGVLGGDRAGAQEDADGQRDRQAEEQHGDPTAAGEPHGRGGHGAAHGDAGSEADLVDRHGAHRDLLGKLPATLTGCRFLFRSGL